MSSRKTKGKGVTKKRAQRATSNVFAMFDQAQIQEFKEAFNMIDQNRDGFIDKEDLHDMLASLGIGGCYLIQLNYKHTMQIIYFQKSIPSFENSVDQDQLASYEASCS